MNDEGFSARFSVSMTDSELLDLFQRMGVVAKGHFVLNDVKTVYPSPMMRAVVDG
jgi:hypothetical protein